MTRPVRACQCARCQVDAPHPDREYHRQMNLLLSRLNEQQRRWYLAVESQRLGHGADRLPFEITAVDEKTIRRGPEGWHADRHVEESHGSLRETPVHSPDQQGHSRDLSPSQ